MKARDYDMFDKPLGEMSIAELCEMVDVCRHEFNEAMSQVEIACEAIEFNYDNRIAICELLDMRREEYEAKFKNGELLNTPVFFTYMQDIPAILMKALGASEEIISRK